MENIDVFIDESGSMGHGRGRYFTIGFVVTDRSNVKKVTRKMKRITRDVKLSSENKSWKNGEVKASVLAVEDRVKVIRRVLNDMIDIYYITADKSNVEEKMYRDKAITYNYWVRLVIEDILKDNPECKTLNIHIDKRTIKVTSGNSFKDYINIYVQYELDKDIQINVEYPLSHLNYGIQIADFISNGINYYYLTKDDACYLEVKDNCRQKRLFPKRYFN